MERSTKTFNSSWEQTKQTFKKRKSRADELEEDLCKSDSEQF